MQTLRFLVTGGSQGIGSAIVELARAGGHQVVFTGRNESLIEKLAQKTGAHGLCADVSSGDDNARTVEACRQRMGGVDVLVNNAGYAYRAEIGDLDVEAMKKMFDTNVFGLVDITNRVVPLLKSQQRGDIVNIASTMAIDAAVMDKPVVAVAFGVKGQQTRSKFFDNIFEHSHYRKLVETAGLRLVQSSNDLADAVRSYLVDPTIDGPGRSRLREELCFQLDGQAGMRAASVVLCELGISQRLASGQAIKIRGGERQSRRAAVH